MRFALRVATVCLLGACSASEVMPGRIDQAAENTESTTNNTSEDCCAVARQTPTLEGAWTVEELKALGAGPAIVRMTVSGTMPTDLRAMFNGIVEEERIGSEEAAKAFLVMSPDLTDTGWQLLPVLGDIALGAPVLIQNRLAGALVQKTQEIAPLISAGFTVIAVLGRGSVGDASMGSGESSASVLIRETYRLPESEKTCAHVYYPWGPPECEIQNMVPGSPAALPLLFGDAVQISVVGTVTAVLGGGVIGFGWPVNYREIGVLSFWSGAVIEPPSGEGSIDAFGRGTIKGSAILGTSGMIGLGASLPFASLSDMQVFFIGDDGGSETESAFHFFDGASVQTPYLIAEGLRSSTGKYLWEKQARFAGGIVNVHFAGSEEGLVLPIIALDGIEPGSVFDRSLMRLRDAIGEVTRELPNITVLSVEAVGEWHDEYRREQILGIRMRSPVPDGIGHVAVVRGDTIGLDVDVRDAVMQTRATIQRALTIPRDLPDGTYRLRVGVRTCNEAMGASSEDAGAENRDVVFEAQRNLLCAQTESTTAVAVLQETSSLTQVWTVLAPEAMEPGVVYELEAGVTEVEAPGTIVLAGPSDAGSGIGTEVTDAGVVIPDAAVSMVPDAGTEGVPDGAFLAPDAAMDSTDAAVNIPDAGSMEGSDAATGGVVDAALPL